MSVSVKSTMFGQFYNIMTDDAFLCQSCMSLLCFDTHLV